jgi:hypothetical protein
MGRRLAVALSCVLLAGCGGPRLGTVSGRVTVGGEPVTSGVVMFQPDDGPAAVGAIGPDATYTLTTRKPGDGALVGRHRVTIQATKVGPGRLVEPKSIEEEIERSRQRGKVLVAGAVTWLVPQKYAQLETSELTATVAAGANTIDFDLPRE